MEEKPRAEKSAGLRLSRFVVSVIGYVSIIFFAWPLVPKQYQPTEVIPALITAKPYIMRIEKFLYANSNPDIILMGSSLVLKPSFECDRSFEDLKVPAEHSRAKKFKQEYTKSAHLGHLLAMHLNRSFDVIDLGIPACMVADYFLTLQKLVDFGKRPQLIVLALAPREFIDNRYPDSKETPSFRIMTPCSPARKWSRHPFAAFDFAWHFLPVVLMTDETLDALDVRAFSFRYAIEEEWNKPFHCVVDQYKQLVASTMPKAMTVAAPGKAKSPETKKYFDLDAYRWSYDSPDADHFGGQISYLEKFIALASHSQIAVVLVDMPITKENQALLRSDVLATYKQTLRGLAAKYNVLLVDPRDVEQFGDQDFVDSVHLNATGGHKCFKSLSEAISANCFLKEKLCTVQSAPQL